MKTQEYIEFLNANAPSAMQTLGGEIMHFDEEGQSILLRFNAGGPLCNHDGAIQGGFICGMLDAAMAHAVFCLLRERADRRDAGNQGELPRGLPPRGTVCQRHGNSQRQDGHVSRGRLARRRWQTPGNRVIDGPGYP